MTNREAIEVLNYLLSTSQSEGAREAHGMAVEALEKQEPRKPMGVLDESLINYGWQYECPICERCVGKNSDDPYGYTDKDDYCPNCGQKLDWED